MEDVLIIGGGAAGLNAASTLGRARRGVVVVDSGKPRNAPADHVHGFLTRDGTPPAELVAIGRSEVERYGGRIVTGAVRTIRRHSGGFRAELADGVIEARRVVVATGLHDELPDIPGLADRWARDVLHCPYCHGWEVRDQPLGVLGLAPRSVHLAWLLPQWSADVVLFASDLAAADRAKVTARGVRIVEDKVIGIDVVDDTLRGVRLANGDVVPRSALFVAGQFIPNDDLLTQLGCAKNETGWVQVDPTGLTSVPGVWAVGNVVNSSAQVISAAAAGATAAVSINGDLIDD
jgi:thioredoxin reductase (NADPH)